MVRKHSAILALLCTTLAWGCRHTAISGPRAVAQGLEVHEQKVELRCTGPRARPICDYHARFIATRRAGSEKREAAILSNHAESVRVLIDGERVSTRPGHPRPGEGLVGSGSPERADRFSTDRLVPGTPHRVEVRARLTLSGPLSWSWLQTMPPLHRHPVTGRAQSLRDCDFTGPGCSFRLTLEVPELSDASSGSYRLRVPPGWTGQLRLGEGKPSSGPGDARGRDQTLRAFGRHESVTATVATGRRSFSWGGPTLGLGAQVGRSERFKLRNAYEVYLLTGPPPGGIGFSGLALSLGAESDFVDQLVVVPGFEVQSAGLLVVPSLGLRGNLVAIFLLTTAIRLPAYARQGLITVPRLLSALALLPAALLGGWLGHRIHLDISEARFRQWVSVALCAIGILLLLR